MDIQDFEEAFKAHEERMASVIYKKYFSDVKKAVLDGIREKELVIIGECGNCSEGVSCEQHPFMRPTTTHL